MEEERRKSGETGKDKVRKDTYKGGKKTNIMSEVERRWKEVERKWRNRKLG